MLRKLYVACALLSFPVAGAFAQTGALKGKITDRSNGEPVPFANIIILKNGVQAGGATTNFDGEYTIKPVDPGVYTVKATYVGFQPVTTEGVKVAADQITDLNIQMSAGVSLGEVEIVQYKDPVFKKDETVVQKTVTREDFEKMPTRSAVTAAATSAGAYQSSEGSSINVRGQRSTGTVYYVDGVKVRGNVSLPQRGIEQVSTILGGVPAQYGDAVGGIINITTRGPSRNYTGGIEGVSSVDGYGYNLIGGNLSGPLWVKRDTADASKDRSIAGFFLSGEAQFTKDGSPSAIGMWKVKDDKLRQLEENPLRPHPSGSGTLREAEFVRADDLEHIKARQNVASKEFRVQGKFDVKPSDNTTVTFGGSVDYDNRHSYIYEYAVFNPGNNPQSISLVWRTYARFTQKFDSDTGSAIKNAFYAIQADYSKVQGKTQDDSHEDRYFNYGYVGRFTTSKINSYNSYGTDTVAKLTGWLHDGFRDTLVTFDRAEINPQMANYTSQYYSIYAGDPVGHYQNLTQIQAGQGLLNGVRPGNVYSLWYNTGREYNGYSISDAAQFRLSATGSADIGDHAIMLGVEYEQRSDRFWNIGPLGLWGLARQLTNFHISNLDYNNPQPVYDNNGVFQDTINYPRLYDGKSQAWFDQKLREKLGKSVTGTEWMDVDSYDPDMYSLDMFSADELLNNGSGYVGYYGYDYLGNKLTSKPSFEDFFNEKDENDNYTRNIAPFEPIYVAGYIQDKFAFKDLIFNIGVRIDRYDANQMVLRDKYLLHEAKTVGEAKGKFGPPPAGIEDDFVVYVNDANNPTSILGYRNGDTWFNGEGIEVADPKVIAEGTSTGTITPYLLDPGQTQVLPSVFKDYAPQTNVMPRVAFSFPISDEAVFFAHYDVLTQRPTSNMRFDPVPYYFIQSYTRPTLQNPDLKPERTTDYEVGFKQRLSPASAISLSAFYRELRDQIQIIPVNYAYPISYNTYGNMDFGTVKGFSAAYDLRRTNNVRLNANYTLQFADGTGSTTTTSASLINDGFPNLRTLSPANYDVRHRFVASVDYRYGSGDKYNGPKWFGKPVFENAGANFIANARSGEPYSRQSNITQTAAFGINDRSRIDGSINGSRLPWQFRLDMRVDKNFKLKFGKGEGEKKYAMLNLYVLVTNLLDADNVTNVYRATGNPDDDGYLSDPTAQGGINAQSDPQSFRDLYTIKVNNPAFYDLPRRMQVGLMLDF